jgi:RHH-type proline utilization regulon transcriptional repressor/proline dehydrogenase/delta 1-pyrroline-5-carboxylate dehydrogenase
MALFTRSKTPAEVAAATPRGDHAPQRIPSTTDPALERRVQEIGREFLEQARRHRGSVLSASFWSDRLMDWAMKDRAFKVQLFRFVDAFPALRTPEQVHEHLADYLSQPGVKLPPGLGVGLKAGGLLKGAMSKTVARQITSMAERFIAGTDAASALPRLRKLWSRGIAFSVDLLGEACVSDAEASAFQARYLDLVDHLPGEVAGWDAQPRLERDHLGPVPRTNVSIKISSLFARTDPIEAEGSVRGLLEALRPILEQAARRGVLVNFDMEQSELKDLTLELFMRCCAEVGFPAGIALQAYLRSGEQDAQRLIDWARSTGRQVTVRLVKGAYWDQETIRAEERGWPVPVWSRKGDTDACFERMTARLLAGVPRSAGAGGVKLALGSHNLRSIAVGLAHLERLGLPREAIELQMLFGMADELKAAAVERGLRLREYVPVGQMIPGMAYLVRRLLENTSNESWLRASAPDQADPERLLAPPAPPAGPDPGVEATGRAPERHQLSPAPPGVGDGRPFFNEPMRDFSVEPQRRAFHSAVRVATVPRVRPDATVAEARAAVATASTAFPAWRQRDARERGEVLTRAASEMRARRDELCGVIIRESGKTWREADADVCEAIDFCTFYARCAVELLTPARLGRFVGELNQTIHEPRGVAVVISPWNFPLAICCGMTTAALVAGNTVVVKPAEQTPAIASLLCEILWRAGAPREVLHFVPGPGESVGAALVREPDVALIAFTGSMAVGLDIIQAAGVTAPQQRQVKRVVCEMGGKNAIVVDASADLDEAVLGVRGSAFSYQGQKCSACSRVIVVESAYEHFLERLVESTRTLLIGDPLEAGTDVGPVIDREAAEKIRGFIEVGRGEGRLCLAMEAPPGLEARVGKPYVGPHIFSGIEPRHRLAQEEIFGPVLAVMRARDFDEALAIANGTRYRLTGGVYSRKPAHLERARREFRVGNLYLNRGTTGALVGRQPFGGAGMSGTGTKAGGRDYLLHFLEPRNVCENTMRRGFAPELEDGTP